MMLKDAWEVVVITSVLCATGLTMRQYGVPLWVQILIQFALLFVGYMHGLRNV